MKNLMGVFSTVNDAIITTFSFLSGAKLPFYFHKQALKSKKTNYFYDLAAFRHNKSASKCWDLD